MSQTKPYPSDWRMQGWGPIERMTPKQGRRFAHKMGRLRDDTEGCPLASYKGAGAKNRPTPRRADARAFARARRIELADREAASR